MRPLTHHATLEARARLTPLLHAAVAVDLDAPAEVMALRSTGHDVTARLAADGRLSPELVVAEDDPGIVVVRTIAAAWRSPAPAGQAAVRSGELAAVSR
jgi:hypothetical protein